MTTASTAPSASSKAKTGKRSRRKGASGESEARKAWKEELFAPVPWRGGMDGPDFIAIYNPTQQAFSVEVTRDSSRFSPLKAWHNLEKAAKGPGIPVSRIRADRKKPIIQMYEEDFFRLVAR